MPVKTKRCVQKRTSRTAAHSLQATLYQSQSVHQLPSEHSQDRTNTKPWQKLPPSSSLSLVETRLSSTLSCSLVASTPLFWPGVVQTERSPDKFFVAFDCLNIAFQLVRDAGLTRNQIESHRCRKQAGPIGSPAGFESRKLHVEHVYRRGAVRALTTHCPPNNSKKAKTNNECISS